jgi:Na+/phosphate symporter
VDRQAGSLPVEARLPGAHDGAVQRRLSWPGLRRAGFAFSGIALFILALETIKGGASGVVPLLDELSVEGPANAVGFGWLMAYVALSGSPVAAIGVTLLAGDVLSQSEAFAVIGGSRLGASFIVLAVGYALYVSRRRNADGLYIGVVALLTTFTTQGPAIALGLVSLHYGWLDGISFATPAELGDGIGAVVGPPLDGLDALLPAALLFLAGLGILIGSFWLFDRALPQLEGEAEGITRLLHALRRRPLMFLLGGAVTATTMSVSISLTVLVPLSMKGYIRRESIIPYVMGANITTFVDTLFASVLLGGDAAFTVVLTQMLSIAAVSAVLLTLLYRPYSSGILVSARWVTARPRHFATFLVAIVGVPLVLLLI